MNAWPPRTISIQHRRFVVRFGGKKRCRRRSPGRRTLAKTGENVSEQGRVKGRSCGPHHHRLLRATRRRERVLPPKIAPGRAGASSQRRTREAASSRDGRAGQSRTAASPLRRRHARNRATRPGDLGREPERALRDRSAVRSRRSFLRRAIRRALPRAGRTAPTMGPPSRRHCVPRGVSRARTGAVSAARFFSGL